MKPLLLTALSILSLAGSSRLDAQPQGYLLSADTISAAYVPTFLGNGNFSIVSSQSGLAPAHSFMAWIFDHAPGDVARIASLPAWNAIEIFNGKSFLSSGLENRDSFEHYRQSLDMYDGVLRTAYTWNDNGRKTGVDVIVFVSRSNPNLAVIRSVLNPHFSGSMRILFPLRAWPSPNRMPLAREEAIQVRTVNGLPDVWYPGHMSIVKGTSGSDPLRALCWLLAMPDGDTTGVAIAEKIAFPEGPGSKVDSVETTDSSTGIGLRIQVNSGKSYVVDKFVTIVSSRESKSPLADAKQLVSAAGERGFERERLDHVRAWHELWNTNIVVSGDPGLQSVVHSSMFYLLCSARQGTDFAIPPMGLSSDGYYGHLFWDSDTWMFPALLLTHPDIARSLVMFRYRTLPAAEANAAGNGHAGAMYPWESDELGNEATPKFAWQNALYENHVTGDVALAQWQYFQATRDTAWLSSYGFPVISQTANFWISRATFDSAHLRYGIRGVVSVDEGLIGVSNDVYTNAVAQRTLEAAIEASRILGKASNPAWERVASGLYIPFNPKTQSHLAYEDVPDSTVGSVAPLLYFPLGYDASRDVMRNDLVNALRVESRGGPGAMMTSTLYPVMAAALQDRRMFDAFYAPSYKGYLRGAFNAFAETPHNQSTNFLTGAGSLLQQVLFGYTGLRLTGDGLVCKFPPMLPIGVKGLEIHNLSCRGKKYDVFVSEGKTRLIEK